MLRSSFINLDKIGAGREEHLWKQGISSWHDFLAAGTVFGISNERKLYYDLRLRQAGKALMDNDSGHFLGLLPRSETWRMYREFRDEALFLDIEVSGMGRHDDVSIISMNDWERSMVMIRGYNLDMGHICRTISRYKLLVTFNGSVHDIPFLQKRYRIPLLPHVDLRHLCARVGLTGGLKEIEKRIGIRRSPIVQKMYSGDPWRLYRMWRASGDEHYLNLLIEYNDQDSASLMPLADYVCGILQNQMRQKIYGHKKYIR